MRKMDCLRRCRTTGLNKIFRLELHKRSQTRRGQKWKCSSERMSDTMGTCEESILDECTHMVALGNASHVIQVVRMSEVVA